MRREYRFCVMAEIKRRPYRVCDSERTTTTGIVVESLAELKERGATKLGLTPASCRVFLERDGTEVDDEEYFSFLEDQTKLMIVSDGEEWMAGSQSASYSQGSIGSFGASLETNESMEFDRTDAGETESISHALLPVIKKDPAFFVSFSDENLQDVINFDTEQFSTALGRSFAEAKHSQEACQQELDRRTQFKEATQLLKLLDRAQQNQGAENETPVGSKRQRTSPE